MKKVSKQNEKVSLILPIYNIEETSLDKCIKSLLKQTYTNIEIILIDDGSTNNSLDICNYFSKLDKRVTVYHQDNSGVSIARNKGIELSNGSFICFIDPDDYVKENYVEKLLITINKYNSDIAICNSIIHYQKTERPNDFIDSGSFNGNDLELTREQIIDLQKQLVGKKISSYYPPEVAVGVPWGKMFKKSFIIDNELSFVPKMARMQDNIFNLYALEKATKVSAIKDRLYIYRKEAGSACYKYSPNIISYFEKYYLETEKFLDKYNKEPIFYKALSAKKITSFNSYFNQLFFNKEAKKKLSEVKKEISKLLEKDIYANALDSIDLSLLTNTEKIFVILLKNKKILALKLLTQLRSMVKM